MLGCTELTFLLRRSRQGSAHRLRDLADLAALDADFAQQLIYQRCLRAIAQCRVHYAVGEVRAAMIGNVGIASASQSVDMHDLDALDALERPRRFANDGVELLDQPQTHR